MDKDTKVTPDPSKEQGFWQFLAEQGINPREWTKAKTLSDEEIKEELANDRG